MQSPDATPCGLELEVKQKRLLAFLLLGVAGMRSHLGLLEAFAVVTVIERRL